MSGRGHTEGQGAIAVVRVKQSPRQPLGIAVREAFRNSFKACRSDPQVKAIVLVCGGFDLYRWCRHQGIWQGRQIPRSARKLVQLASEVAASPASP